MSKITNILEWVAKLISRSTGGFYRTRVQAQRVDELSLIRDNKLKQLIARETSLKNNVTSVTKKYTELLETRPNIDRNKLQAWSKRIRLIGSCDICKSEHDLTAHHLWDKKNHPSLMYQDENGVCLCITCHDDFHRKYTPSGGGHVTPKMYHNFKIKKIHGILD